jgi:carboxypeptidase T
LLDYTCYKTVVDLYAACDGLVSSYPSLVTWTDIGDSWEKGHTGDPAFPSPNGFDIKALKLTSSVYAGTKFKILITGGMHSIEVLGAETAYRFAEYLLANYATNPDIAWLLDYGEVHVIPMVNPDGHIWVEQAAHYEWRKNCDSAYGWGGGGGYDDYGVNINRNFSYQWSSMPGDQFSVPTGANYPGPYGNSEPETQAIQAYMSSIFAVQLPVVKANNTGLYIDLHSGRLPRPGVEWPLGYTLVSLVRPYDVAPEDTELQRLGKKIAYFNGYDAIQLSFDYLGTGTAPDHAYGTFGVGALCIEIGYGTHTGTPFNLYDCATYVNTILQPMLDALVQAAKSARRPFTIPAGPDITDYRLFSNDVVVGTSVRLEAYADGTRYYGGDVPESPRNVGGIKYSIDAPPWVATPVEMTAKSVYNSPLEWGYSDVSTVGLSIGHHTIFIQGRDSAGNDGAVKAIQFNVVAALTLSLSNIDFVKLSDKTGYPDKYGLPGITGYAFGCEVNGYIYLAPCYIGLGDEVHGKAVRYKITNTFTDLASWEVKDLALIPNRSGNTFNVGGTPKAVGFHGACYYGGYIYYAPLYNWGGSFSYGSSGNVVRYNTAMNFNDDLAWEIIDITTFSGMSEAKGFVGVVNYGKFMYFVPYYGNNNLLSGDIVPGAHSGYTSSFVVRYDTSLPFTSAAAWSGYDYLSSIGNGGWGYHLACVGRGGVYFSPNKRVTVNGTLSSSIVLRFNPTNLNDPTQFNNPAYWQTFSLTSLSSYCRGMYGCVYADPYVYFAFSDKFPNAYGNPPMQDGFQKGIIARYNTYGSFLDYSSWEIYDTDRIVRDKATYLGQTYNCIGSIRLIDGQKYPDGIRGYFNWQLDPGDGYYQSPAREMNSDEWFVSGTGSAGPSYDGLYVYFPPDPMTYQFQFTYGIGNPGSYEQGNMSGKLLRKLAYSSMDTGWEVLDLGKKDVGYNIVPDATVPSGVKGSKTNPYKMNKSTLGYNMYIPEGFTPDGNGKAQISVPQGAKYYFEVDPTVYIGGPVADLIMHFTFYEGAGTICKLTRNKTTGIDSAEVCAGSDSYIDFITNPSSDVKVLYAIDNSGGGGTVNDSLWVVIDPAPPILNKLVGCHGAISVVSGGIRKTYLIHLHWGDESQVGFVSEKRSGYVTDLYKGTITPITKRKRASSGIML